MFKKITSVVVLVTSIVFSASSAFAASIYEITVTGTLLQTVTTDDGNRTFISNDVYSSAFGKSFEMTWSAPLDTLLDPSNASTSGSFSAAYDGSELPPERPGALGGLRVSQSSTGRSVSVFAALPKNAFGSDVAGFNASLRVQAFWGDYDPYDVSYTLPRELDGDIYEIQYIRFTGTDNVRRCTSRYCYNSIVTSFGYASIDSVTYSTQPSTVPLPASALFLGAGLSGLGFLRRRRKAA